MIGHPVCPTCGHEFTTLPRIDAMIAAMGLTGIQKRLLTILAAGRGRYLTAKELASILYDREDGGPEYAEGSLHVAIAKLREKLAGYGLQIEGLRAHGGGFRLWVIETSQRQQGGYQLVKRAA